MRHADATRIIDWRSYSVTIEQWADPTDLPWDGDGPAPDCDGWDLFVRATLLMRDGHRFVGTDGLGACYGDRAYLEGCLADVEAEALENLMVEIKAVADGRDLRAARKAASVAKRITRSLP